jgi:hypothetical protein
MIHLVALFPTIEAFTASSLCWSY